MRNGDNATKWLNSRRRLTGLDVVSMVLHGYRSTCVTEILASSQRPWYFSITISWWL